MKILCIFGLHKWRVTRTESIRYGVLITSECMRFCGEKKTFARW